MRFLKIATPLLLAAALGIFLLKPESATTESAAIPIDGPSKSITPPPPVQIQGPSAPERARQAALSQVAPGQLPKTYTPGVHEAPADDPRVARRPDGKVAFRPMVEFTQQLHDAHSPPEHDLEILDAVVGTYRSIYRQNPVAGLNHEVTSVFTGKNEKNVILIEPTHPAINALGELTDRWGTPYHFHGISSQQWEIQSAGPDRKFGTSDDIELGDAG